MDSWTSQHPEEAKWLLTYQGNFAFYLSLQDQFRRFRKLSPAQTACVRRAIERESGAVAKDRVFTLKAGELVEIKSWMARVIATEMGQEFGFRNLKIETVEDETGAAWKTSFRFSHDVAASCGICGRDLDNEFSRATGIGPVCASKLGIKRVKEEDTEAVRAELRAYCERIGVIGPRWVPKAQVKRKVVEMERNAS